MRAGCRAASAVEALLRAGDQPDDDLDRPAFAVAVDLERTIESPTATAGTVLGGRYKLIDEIGEGGMGTVWMAQQTEPVKRLVAAKLIKPGMDSKRVMARFEAERQALALMDHPNIARVLDGGETESGRPYFVMELVKGIPITKYCDDHHLTPRQRLELFLPVCHAIQHAHQKGVIHRDLKPSNVLVAQYDDRPVPKVIDFGVAKATGTPLTEQTLHTGFGAVVGTVEYMSPEQASLNQLDIDTRSDIYSLGVLLYELLAGSPPFSRKELETAGVLEMLRVIREREPPKPSTKLSTAEGLPALAANRGTEPRRLTALLRGELDWIVMKALEKERSRRYETANGLAMDLQRYLADEPVQACPPSTGYRLRKFVKRNRGAVFMAAAVAGALIAGTAIAAWQAARATRAAKAETEQRERADLKADEAKTNELRALEEKGRADQKAEESRQRLVRQYVSHGARHVDEGDWLGSLPWFVEALALERDPQVQLMHRTRLGALLRLAPRLEQVWTHDGWLTCARFSPDGTRVVTAGAGTDRLGVVQVWDARTGRPTAPPLRHQSADRPPDWEQPVQSIAFSPDGKLLATEKVREIVVWEAASGRRVSAWDQPGYLHRMRFTPDGSRLLLTWAKSIGREASVYEAQAWDARTGKPVSPLISSKHVYSDGGGDGDAVFSPDGTRLTISDQIGGESIARGKRGDGQGPVHTETGPAEGLVYPARIHTRRQAVADRIARVPVFGTRIPANLSASWVRSASSPTRRLVPTGADCSPSTRPLTFGMWRAATG